MQRPATRIEISIARQELALIREESTAVSYPVSTSKFGLGTEEGSNKTPLGSFQVLEKIGDGEPLGTIFESRVPTGVWDSSMLVDADLVLTRILWLDGLEPENANTHDRYIYIHGTNQEQRIGEAASYGCIRMKNVDVIELFDLTPSGTAVFIES